MSAIVVRQTTQKIVVDSATGAVSVISTGPQGPAGPPGTNGVIFSDTPPAATVGDLWLNTNTFVLSALYNDGDSVQWVETGVLDVSDVDLPALASALVPYILGAPEFGASIDLRPPVIKKTNLDFTLSTDVVGRLSQYTNEGLVTITIPTDTFTNGDWFSIQSLGSGGITFVTTGITVETGGTIPDIAQYDGLTILFSDANTITFFGGGAA